MTAPANRSAVRIHHQVTAMTDAAKPAVKVRYYRFRNKLREKTAGLVGAGTAGGGRSRGLRDR